MALDPAVVLQELLERIESFFLGLGVELLNRQRAGLDGAALESGDISLKPSLLEKQLLCFFNQQPLHGFQLVSFALQLVVAALQGRLLTLQPRHLLGSGLIGAVDQLHLLLQLYNLINHFINHVSLRLHLQHLLPQHLRHGSQNLLPHRFLPIHLLPPNHLALQLPYQLLFRIQLLLQTRQPPVSFLEHPSQLLIPVLMLLLSLVALTHLDPILLHALLHHLALLPERYHLTPDDTFLLHQRPQ